MRGCLLSMSVMSVCQRCSLIFLALTSLCVCFFLKISVVNVGTPFRKAKVYVIGRIKNSMIYWVVFPLFPHFDFTSYKLSCYGATASHTIFIPFL